MLTLRQQEILKHISKQEGYVTSQQLADEYEVSQRTIRTDIQCIQSELRKFGAEIKSRPKVGFRLVKSKGINLVELLNQPEQNLSESRVLAIMLLLAMYEKLTTERLEQKLQVSRNTIVADMKAVAKKVAGAGLELYAKSYDGTQLLGEEIVVRNFAFKVQGELRKLNPKFLVEINAGELAGYKLSTDSLISYVEEFIGAKLSDEAVTELRDMIPLCLRRSALNRYALPSTTSEDLSKLRAGIYSYLSEFSNVKITEGDAEYLAILFAGAQKLNQSEKFADSVARDCREFLLEYAAEVNIAIDFEDVLVKQFVVHLQTAVFRLQHDLPIENELLDEIQYASSFVYDTAKRLLHKYEVSWKVSMPDTEIAFVTIYLEALLQQYSEKERPLRVIVVCHGGMATSTLLKNRLAVCMPTLRIEKICRYEDLDKELPILRPDLILTTLGMNIPGCQCVQVNPILPSSDIKKISEALSRIAYRKRNDILISKTDNDNLSLIEELLPQEFCQFLTRLPEWKIAIRLAAAPLVRAGKITSDYAEDMIGVVKKMGNYMIFIPEIAFVHAKTDNVIENGIAALFFPDTIDFGSLTISPVKVLVVVANREENFVLTRLIRLLMQGGNIEKFKRARTYEDLKLLEGK